MRDAGVRGLDAPNLETLAAAETPPRPVWRAIPIPAPAPEKDIHAQAKAMVESMAWRQAQTMLSSKQDQVRRAVQELRHQDASSRLAAPRREMTNAKEYEAGQALAAKWTPVLDALDDVLTHAEERIPNLSLAALREAELKDLAETAALEQQDRYHAMLGGSGTPVTPEQLREMDSKTHLRRLRKKAKEARQYAAALFGTVGEKGSIYSDTFSKGRWKERQASAKAFAEGRLLVLANGKTVPLADVLASSLEAHKARLYAMAKGMDEMAVRLGWAAVFVTVTLPPQHHPNPSKGANCYDPTISPAETDEALSALLTKLRSRMRGKKIVPYGIPIKEPHKDGCPHAHIMLYMPGEQVDALDTILQELLPEPVPGERIATKLVRIDRARALPTTYLFKYLMKSVNAPIDTDQDDDGREDGDHLANHEAVRAWASERGVRRWATWGTHGVQRIWQAIQQRKTMPEDAPASVKAAWLAIAERRYADALDHMGAIRGSKKPRMRLTYEDRETEYGDTRKRPCGIGMEGAEWTMPLKACKSEVMSLSEHRYRLDYPEQDDEDREAKDDARWFARLPAILQNRRPALAVSYPRGGNEPGGDGNPRSTAGPPGHNEAAAARAEPPEIHPNSQGSRTRVECGEQAANPRRRMRTTPDDIDRMAEGVLAAMRDGLAEAVSSGSYEDALAVGF